MRDRGPIEILPATADRFDDLATLVGPKHPGAPACWCLAPRLASSENRRLRGAARPERLRELCAQDPTPGVIAYLDGVPAGWCACGPRAEMGRLVRSRTIPQVDDLPVWSVICIVVAVGYRRQGLAYRLVEGAVAYAHSKGAEMVEAYPIDTAGKRVSTSFAYCGTTGLFEQAGFTRVAMTSARSAGLPRWIYRRSLAPDA
jgi:GNAT superfamily N-acetyltransferase